MKYIDAEELKEKISNLENHRYYSGDFHDGVLFTIEEVQSIVGSLQQEQPDNEDIDKVAQELYEHLYELKRRNNVPTNLYDKQEIIDLWKAGAEWQRQQGIVWSEKDEEKKAYDKGFKAAEEFYCGRII